MKTPRRVKKTENPTPPPSFCTISLILISFLTQIHTNHKSKACLCPFLVVLSKSHFWSSSSTAVQQQHYWWGVNYQMMSFQKNAQSWKKGLPLLLLKLPKWSRLQLLSHASELTMVWSNLVMLEGIISSHSPLQGLPLAIFVLLQFFLKFTYYFLRQCVRTIYKSKRKKLSSIIS